VCIHPSSSVIPSTKISRRSSWKYNPCLRGWTKKFWSAIHFYERIACTVISTSYIWMLHCTLTACCPALVFPSCILSPRMNRSPPLSLVSFAPRNTSGLLSFCKYSCGIIHLFMIFTSAPVSTRARMENVLSSTKTSSHIFNLSGYSLDLYLLVWLTDFHFLVTLGHEALCRTSESPGLGLSFPRSALDTDTERYEIWGFSASFP
jgi:hypothetical protein